LSDALGTGATDGFSIEMAFLPYQASKEVDGQTFTCRGTF
jgi:hypothetical protein